MGWPLRRWLALTALCSAALAGPASAQETGDEARYRQLIAEGVAEFDNGLFREARAIFSEAHALNPNARTFRVLGMVAFELREYSEARQLLQKALTDTRKPLTDEQRAKATELLERSRRFVGVYALSLTPPTAVLSVDGKPASLDGNTLVLDAGRHELSASAPGHAPASRSIEVRGGEAQSLQLSLPALESSPEPIAPTPVEKVDSGEGDGLLSSWVFWTVAGVVVAGTAVTIAVLAGGGQTTTADTIPGDDGLVAIALELP